jgi:hypothetical protein
MFTTIRRVALATLLAVGLAACGGGSDDTAGDASDTGSQEDTGSGDGSGGDPSGGRDEGDESDDDTTIITVGDIPGYSEACEAITNFIGATGQLLSGQLDPASGRAIIDDFLASVDDSIRADAQVMADYTVAILELIEQTGSFEAALSSPEGMEALGGISTPEYETAARSITAYLTEECDLPG